MMNEMVVIPALNESATIWKVVKGVRAVVDFPVVVVDDASVDGTGEEARRAGAVVLKHVVSLGAWCAIQTGMRWAVLHGAQRVITMDADGQHGPEDVPALIHRLREGDLDVVIGSCVHRGQWKHHLAWFFMRRVSGLPVVDITSGFRAYGPRALAVVTLPEATLLEYQDVGILLMLQHHGLRIGEVSICMHPRRHSRSRLYGRWGQIGWYLAYSLLLSLCKRNGTGALPRVENSASPL